MCVAQKFIEEKTNEILAAQEVLCLMDLRNTIVTADAMNCQKETVKVITEDIGWYSEKKEWKKLKTLGMVHKVLC